VRCLTIEHAARYNVRVADTRFLGIDLAWREGNGDPLANETGVALIDGDGRIRDAGWTRGVEQTISWADIAAGDGDAVMFADAPLVVSNETGQRLCETQVGQRYGRWKVSANTTNIHSPRLAGVQFLRLAGLSGWQYSDGSDGPPRGGRFISETYPYATLVGAAELGYDTERPRYKRKPPRLPAAQRRTERAANCDTLIGRLRQLADADPPLLLQSHPVTRELAEQPSPVSDSAYKHREDLIDALLCAWTASLWARHSFDRCQVLGQSANPSGDLAATMIVPARARAASAPVICMCVIRGVRPKAFRLRASGARTQSATSSGSGCHYVSPSPWVPGRQRPAVVPPWARSKERALAWAHGPPRRSPQPGRVPGLPWRGRERRPPARRGGRGRSAARPGWTAVPYWPPSMTWSPSTLLMTPPCWLFIWMLRTLS
jgi:predicted RNase H-like nuclease